MWPSRNWKFAYRHTCANSKNAILFDLWWTITKLSRKNRFGTVASPGAWPSWIDARRQYIVVIRIVRSSNSKSFPRETVGKTGKLHVSAYREMETLGRRTYASYLRKHSRACRKTSEARLCSRCSRCTCSNVTAIAVRSLALLQPVNLAPFIDRQTYTTTSQPMPSSYHGYWCQRQGRPEAWQPSPKTTTYQVPLEVKDKVWRTPGELGVSKSFRLWYFLPSVLWHCWLGDRKGIRPVKSCVGLLVVMIWLELCTRLIAPVVTSTSIILSSNRIQNGDSPHGMPKGRTHFL